MNSDILVIPCGVLLVVGCFALSVLWGKSWQKRAQAAEKKLGYKIKDLKVKGEE